MDSLPSSTLVANPKASSSLLRRKNNITDNVDESEYYYVRPKVIYGHVHIYKTGGSNLNGRMAAKYERVCGNKGYTYDAFQFNQRAMQIGDHYISKAGGNDLVTTTKRKFNRGRLPVDFQIMDEIGYEDCDFISLETSWEKWFHLFPPTVDNSHIDWKLELHIPCRNLVDQLMSSCNHQHYTFDCNAIDLEQEVKNCILPNFENLLHRDLVVQARKSRQIDIQCFNALPHDPYLQYMGNVLQARRFEAPYFQRTTNDKRVKDHECVWKHPDLVSRIQSILLKDKFPYWYQFCNECMKSDNRLVLD